MKLVIEHKDNYEVFKFQEHLLDDVLENVITKKYEVKPMGQLKGFYLKSKNETFGYIRTTSKQFQRLFDHWK